MTSERWHRIEQIYNQAAARPRGERAIFLDEACAGDVDLRREVEGMLASESGATGFLEAPAMEVAARALAANAVPIAPGSRFGPYEIVSPIGKGGMGEVYKARDTRLGRTVAIKVVNAEFAKRFEREAKAISALNHPQICTLHDVGPNYLVMELIEGLTLAERSRKVLSHSRKRWPSRARSPRPWRRRTKEASCIATSSRPISSSHLRAM